MQENNKISLLEPSLADIQAGLPAHFIKSIIDFLGISYAEFTRITGLSSSVIRRREMKDNKLNVEESNKIASIIRVIVLAKASFTCSDDVTRLWFFMPHPALNEERPIDHLQTEVGRRLVERSIIGASQPSFSTFHSPSELMAMKKTELNEKRIFLCHGKEDKLLIRKLYNNLKDDGMIPWFDEENLIGGVEWEQAIREAVRASDIVLVCLSINSASKIGFVQKEIKIALDAAEERPEGTIYIIPVMLEQCQLPQRLSKWHAVNYFEKEGYTKLLLAVEKSIQIVNT
ncbi:TIR domain-containing protein [Vreelandella sedimenti]|nr:TIR domain-containing protein [Halomonas sedimenti]